MDRLDVRAIGIPPGDVSALFPHQRYAIANLDRR